MDNHSPVLAAEPAESVLNALAVAAAILRQRDGVLRFVNPAFVALLGYRSEDLVGQPWSDLCLQSSGGEFLAIRPGATRPAARNIAMRLRCKDGGRVEAHVSAAPCHYAGEACALLTVLNITEFKATERELRTREGRLRAILEVSQAGVGVIDPQGHFTFANRRMAEMFGYEPDEFLGTSYAEHLHADEQDTTQAKMAQLLSGAVDKLVVERHYRRKDGSSFWGLLSTGRTVDSDGGAEALVGVLTDITPRKQFEADLRSSEAKFALAFQEAPLLMVIARLPDGALLDVNEQFCAISGFTREEAVGKTALELGWTNPRDVERVRARLTAGGPIQDAHRIFRAKDGREIHGMYRSGRVTIGGVDCLLSTVVDITDKLRMEEELARAQKLESLGVLAGGIAHDFNNLLTGVLGNLSLALTQLGPDHPAQAAVLDCKTAATRAADLTGQLLTFARGGAPNRRPIATERIVQQAVPFALRGSNVKGVIELDRGLWLLDADEGQITQVLSNLLINAKQAMPAGGTVVISGHNVEHKEDWQGLKAGRYVCLSVSDSGPGIEESIADKIFDPYFTTKVGGTGLGLASVYSIVRRHGGQVQVRSKPQQGATFVICLPASDAPDEGQLTARSADVATNPAGLPILVMDDDALVRKVVGAMLVKLGYRPTMCTDGAVAIAEYRAAAAAGRPFAAVLLDLTVPGGMGGLQAAKHIRAGDPDAVLVVSSGYSNDEVLANCRAHGFVGAVSKPYTVQTLAIELSRVLGDRAPA